MPNETTSQTLRVSIGAAFFAVFMYISFVTAGWSGWSTTGRGPQNVTGHLDLFLLATIEGLVAVAGARLIIGWRVLSPWLLVALVIPGYYALDAAGLT